MMGLFGPFATRGSTVTTSQWVQPTSGSAASVFYESWRAEGTSASGIHARGDYNILPPTGDKAFFNFLLDASGSTWPYYLSSTGEKKRIYEYLLENFEKLVKVLRPNDQIFVWLFNKKTQLVCQVEQKDFHKQIDLIRRKYRQELDVATNYQETRLYDAVGTVMDTIHETWRKNKKADFFLVPFTDGQDNTSTMYSVKEMCAKVTSVQLPSRLHTFFITANLPADCELYRQLEHQSELSLIKLENTHPGEISRGFNTLREMIKAILVVVTQSRDEMTMMRIADYGPTRHVVAENMLGAVATRTEADSSWLEGWHSLRTLPWGPTN